MNELLQFGPQLGVAVFVVVALIVLMREQRKNGGIGRDEFTTLCSRMESKMDRMESKIDSITVEQNRQSVEQAEHAEQLVELRAVLRYSHPGAVPAAE